MLQILWDGPYIAYRAGAPVPKPLLMIAPAVVLGVGIVCARKYSRRQFKRVLCSTEYAKQNNITADQQRM